MHIDMIKTPDKPGVYKFVKVNGEYRFIESFAFGGGHSSLVDEGEEATSAGSIFILDNGDGEMLWRIEDYYSTTLKVACKGGEQEEIQEILGNITLYDLWG